MRYFRPLLYTLVWGCVAGDMVVDIERHQWGSAAFTFVCCLWLSWRLYEKIASFQKQKEE